MAWSHATLTQAVLRPGTDNDALKVKGDNIASAIGVSIHTIQSWLGVLVAGGIVRLLQPYFERSNVKRIVKRPKVYFCDTGLACYLAKVFDAKTLRVGYLGGHMVETGTVEEVFSNPKTEAGRRLVFPEGANIDQFPVAGVVRVVFNGGSSYEPLIASLAIDCGVKVNILGADTRNVNGKAFGSMLLGLPEDKSEAAKAMSYLKAQKDVTVEEVPDYHG